MKSHVAAAALREVTLSRSTGARPGLASPGVDMLSRSARRGARRFGAAALFAGALPCSAGILCIRTVMSIAMRFNVRLLRDHGRRLSREEILQSPIWAGRLWVHDVRKQITQTTVMANLMDHRGTTAELSVLPPLMNPHIVRWDVRGIFLAGIEVASEFVEGQLITYEHGQTWWLIPEGSPWRPDDPTEYPKSTRDAMDRNRSGPRT